MNEEKVTALTTKAILDALRPGWVKNLESYVRAADAAIEEARRHLDEVRAIIEEHTQ